MDSVVYPVGHEALFRTLSTCLTLIAVSTISYCFALRAFYVDFSPRALFSMKATKWILLLIFIDSWAFVFLSGILVNGVGTSFSPATCSLGLYSCILFYCASKLLTYLFLLEKVYIVWPNNGTRWSCTAYKVGFVALLGFVVVIIMIFLGRFAYIREDNQCVLGLGKTASMTTLFIDLALDILLTFLFIWPLWRCNSLSANLRRVASRTLVASFCTLTTSVTNLTILTALHGREIAWICLASCSTDVLVNALVLFWLTRSRHSTEEQSSGAAAGMQDRVRSDQGKSAGAVNHVHLRSASGAAGSLHGKTHMTADDVAMKKVDLEGGAKGEEQYPYYSMAYDGPMQYSGQQGSPILVPPTFTSNVGEKNSSSPTEFSYPPLSPPPLSHHLHNQHRRHQRSHTVEFHKDKSDRKARKDVDRHSFLEGFETRNRSNSNVKHVGILERLGLRSTPRKDALARYADLGSIGGVGMKRRTNNEEENMKVTVTVTTRTENEDDAFSTDVEAVTKGNE